MIVGGQTEARAQLPSTIIDYHEPFDQGSTQRQTWAFAGWGKSKIKFMQGRVNDMAATLYCSFNFLVLVESPCTWFSLQLGKRTFFSFKDFKADTFCAQQRHHRRCMNGHRWANTCRTVTHFPYVGRNNRRWTNVVIKDNHGGI